MTDFPLVLASNSPRRRELLSLGGWVFKIDPADVDETRLTGESPADYVLRLAEAKARACADSFEPGGVMLGADTTVVDGDEILGKPADAAEAARMLQQLRGRTHQVYTAIALYVPGNVSESDVSVKRPLDRRRERSDDKNRLLEGSNDLNRYYGTLLTDICITDVPMRSYTDAEINAYAATGDPLDKAGAYAIQHAGFHPVEYLAGCYASVMGLPLCHLARSLRKLGLTPETNISMECQAHLHYDCPVTHAILRGESVG